MTSKMQLLAAAALTLTASTYAATDLWTGAASANWNTTDANWNNGGTNLYTSADIVQFGDLGGANLTINITAAVTPASVSFTDTGVGTNAYVFNGAAINGTGTTVSLNSGFGGSVRFNVANGYTGGTTISSGTVFLGVNGALGTGAISMAGGTLSSIAASRTYTNAISFATGTTSNLTTNTGDLSINSVWSGSGDVNVGSNTGGAASVQTNDTLANYTGTITYTSSTIANLIFSSALNTTAKFVTAGTTASGQAMRFAGTSSIGELSGNGGRVGGAASGATLTVNQSTDTTFGGVLVDTNGTFNFRKSGSGTLTLSGANTNTGTTTVNGGKLLITGSLGVGAVSVESAGTLGGTGTIGGAITSAGIIAPGTTGVGNLTSSSSLTLNSGASFKFDLAAGNLSDRLILAGGLIRGTNTSFNFDFGGTGVDGNTYTLLTFGSLGGGFTAGNVSNFTYSNLASGLNGTFSLTGNSLTFFTAVPEPHEYAILISGLLLALIVVRHRRRMLTA